MNLFLGCRTLLKRRWMGSWRKGVKIAQVNFSPKNVLCYSPAIIVLKWQMLEFLLHWNLKWNWEHWSASFWIYNSELGWGQEEKVVNVDGMNATISHTLLPRAMVNWKSYLWNSYSNEFLPLIVVKCSLVLCIMTQPLRSQIMERWRDCCRILNQAGIKQHKFTTHCLRSILPILLFISSC